MAIPMLKIRRPTGRLIFNMGIPIPGKTVFYIETGPRHPRVEIRASIDVISPLLLAMCSRLHQQFCGMDKDTHQITKPCKYHPLKTCNNDGITLGKFLASKASAMLGYPKLDFRAPVGAPCGGSQKCTNITNIILPMERKRGSCDTLHYHPKRGWFLQKKTKHIDFIRFWIYNKTISCHLYFHTETRAQLPY